MEQDEAPDTAAQAPAAVAYPDDGPLAIIARVALAGAVLAICVYGVTPPNVIPRLVYSYHLEHFAAFFVLATVAAAAVQRRRVDHLFLGLTAFALAAELARLLPPAHRHYSFANLAADIGGEAAALAAVAVGGFRARFPRPRKS